MSTPSVTLSQDSNTSLDGVILKWVTSGLNTSLKEITLIYYKNTSDADIYSLDLATNINKYNLQSLDSGVVYSFQLQVVDALNVTAYSNTLVLTAPYVLAPPVISGITGSDLALHVQLATTSNTLSTSDTVEFVLKKPDNSLFWIIKPYASSGQYTLSNGDSARLVNNISYRVACMFQPASSNSLYSSPSNMSNSFTGTPSNTPNIARSVTASSVGTSALVLNYLG